jgi:hypothetical protein
MSTENIATATVKIHGNTRNVNIELDGMSVDEFVSKFKAAFGIPDNATVLVNGREGDKVTPGDTVTFQTKASSKA